MARVACLLVAAFPLAALVRANPDLRDMPLLALTREHAPLTAELCAVSERARAARVRVGMTVAQAQSLAPGLIVMRRCAAAERSAADALLEVAHSLSPAVEAGTPGCVWLDVEGLERLYGAEEEIARALLRRAARVGLEASVGIASGKEIAYLAARRGKTRVIAPQAEREFLERLPLDLLDPGDELKLTLSRWGLRRLGELARLDAHAAGSRLGARGAELIRLARGESARPPLAPQPPERVFEERVELEYAAESLEPLGFLMHTMLKRLVERLQLCGLLAGDMTLELKLLGRRRDSRRVVVAAAADDARPLLELLKLSLEQAAPPAAVEAVRIVVEPRAPRPLQGDMFAPARPAPARLQTTIALLATLCGPDGVGTLEPRDSYRPEAAAYGPFTPAPPRLPAEKPVVKGVAQLALRAIRPAEEIEVMCARDLPEFVRGRTVCARVLSAAGPWRRQGEWWRQPSTSFAPAPAAPTEKRRLASGPPQIDSDSPPAASSPLARDYYELALDDGAVYRVFYDLCRARWFLDGIYD
jgi:protein ImuB